MDGLSAPHTKAGRLQRACLDLLREHEADGALPTSIRFLFYELVSRGVVPKAYSAERTRTPSQDISEAVKHLRQVGVVPWDWIVDESRALHSQHYAPSVYEYVEDILPVARMDLWNGQAPPLILCESRSLVCCAISPQPTCVLSPPQTARLEDSCTPWSGPYSLAAAVPDECSIWATSICPAVTSKRTLARFSRIMPSSSGRGSRSRAYKYASMD
jgi:hypothetical protein